ncbi:MAG: choice-of-anchor J domain-containing protein [Muribaculaceae bacterium]|nr:choice-of-anchor J domain-containing protein [Muribaculaceae bacterium]
MRKRTLLCLAVATAMSAAAQIPASRGASATPLQVKRINTLQHAATARPAAPKRVAGEVPANTVEVPFTHNLGKDGPAEVANYTSVNVNGDNREWLFRKVNGYASCMAPNADNIDANDDWLITVPVHMTAGNYVLSYEVGYLGSGATGVELDVKLGTAPSVEGMIAEIVPTTTYDKKDMTKYEYNCAIPEEGYYYIGFHCTTPKAAKGAIKLTNVGLRAGSVEPPVTLDPPAAGTLTWELAPKGELKATITYTAPTKTKSGADLTEISRVELTSRWGVDKFTYDNVAPGQVITEEVEMYAGYNNRFTGVAYAGNAAGDMVEHKNIYCGPDNPLPPADVKLTVADDYRSATLSWTAPGEVGENGGYVDTEKITYYVFDAFGSYYDPALYTTDRTSITIQYPQLDGQDFFAYQVTAGIDETYYSLDTASNIATVGEPDALPFTESFKDGYYDGMWLIDPASTGSGTQQYGTITDEYFASLFDPDDPDAPEPLKSRDGDGGFFYWLPIERNAVFGLVSVRADISKAAHPVLDFWYQGQGSVFDVLVAGGAADLKVVKSIDMHSDPTTGWTLARVPLDEFKAAGAVQFELRLTAAHNDDEHIWSVPFDAIRVHDLAEKNLALVAMQAPASAAPGAEITLKARVENLGTAAANGASLVLKADGAEVSSVALPALEANAIGNYEVAYTVPVNAPGEIKLALSVVFEGDALAGDNTAEATLAVTRKDFATVADLSATVADDVVTLAWSAPVNGASEPKAIDEDFESEDYAPMTTAGVGEWTVHDGDGAKTYNVFRELYNPAQTQPMAFQLFNRDVAQVPASYYDDAAAHSGSSFMLAPSAQGAQNDNWLISPELSGEAQTVTFWARSYIVAWPETISVYYSTTDASVEAFTAEVTVAGLPESRELPEEWTQYSFTLPAGATHFAFRHDSYDTLALFLDDVSFEGMPDIPADLAVTGYHVFCNGRQLTDEPVEALTYVHKPLEGISEDGDYDFAYTVVPVYNHGGAGHVSNEAKVSLTLSGIIEIAIGDVDAATAVYTLSGIRVAASDITPGIYIIVRGDKAEKALIK